MRSKSFTLNLTTYLTTRKAFGFRVTAVEPLTQAQYDERLADIAANPWITRVVNGTVEIVGYRGSEAVLTIRYVGTESFAAAFGWHVILLPGSKLNAAQV